MSRCLSENLRTVVELRAKNHCEYCRIAIEDTYFGGEIDHIISIKHRGKTESENLASGLSAVQPQQRQRFRFNLRKIKSFG